MTFNKLYFEDELLVQNYKTFLSMPNEELKEKSFLLSIQFQPDFISFFQLIHEKLKFVESSENLKNELQQFKANYFKNFKAKTPELENIDNFAVNFQNMKLKEIKETAEKSKEVFDLYNANKNYLKKIFLKKFTKNTQIHTKAN